MKPVEQRRTSQRLRTLSKGHIVFNNGLSRMECVVRDLSATGARLMFAQPVKVPAEFELQIPHKAIIRHAQVIWYDGRNHGVMFLDQRDGKALSALLPDHQASEPSASNEEASTIPDILDEARQRIARLLGVSADLLQLKVEIDR